MLGIYAQSFMTATRTGTVRVKDVPPAKPRRARWWHRAKTRCIDPGSL